MSINNEAALTVDSADVIRLIEAHLIESGLHESSRVIQEESGVGNAGLASSSHGLLSKYCFTGEWGKVLKVLSTLRDGLIPRQLQAQVYEMAILELGEHGEMELAYTTLRLVAEELDLSSEKSNGSASPAAKLSSSQTADRDDEMVLKIPPSRIIDQQLAALMSLRSKSPAQNTLPTKYYGEWSRQQRRESIGQRLSKAIPILPPSRLNTLLQQAIKWQSYTGQLPQVRKAWDEDDTALQEKAYKKPKKIFDLVLGEVDSVDVAGDSSRDLVEGESIPSKPYSSIKFGKKATAECALFLPDASGLVTGSSDGLVEIWDPQQRFSKLRKDLAYQKEEEFLGHDTAIMAMTVSNDGAMLVTGDLAGKVKVWNLASGKCLREISAHESSISSVALVPDGTHVLTGSHDGTCREFGLRTSRLLKEFRGHSSYVQTCQYIHFAKRNADDDDDEDDGKKSSSLGVISGGADGTVRIWDYRSAEVLRVLRPISLGSSLSTIGSSLVIDAQSDLSNAGGSPSIHTICCLHTPADSFIIVPRGSCAFLVNYHGKVLLTFQNTSAKDAVFVSATVSPSNRWLYVARDDGVCSVFDIMRQGELETTLRNFATETATGSALKDEQGMFGPEITGVVHHPHKGILAAFSSDKNQKRGRLTLWK